ncbi:MAG: M14 family zinc carboxypeptidase, partial [Gemmatimonadaceae bacterium]
YYLTSGMHSTETGGPEMLMELAYRLVVEESPLVQSIRDNVITFITPVIEVDGREKIVDGCYFKAKNPTLNQPTPYWGKYVAHDNNRDGMGQYLKLTQAVEKLGLDWHPTILHDLHEAQTLLYASTGTGPYNEQLDPITINEWWMMAENDVMEMTKRGVPGVWTYGFYDGWVPNYMFYVVHAHNAVGRFYEVQSYGSNCTGSSAPNSNQGAGGRGGFGAPDAAATPPANAGTGTGRGGASDSAIAAAGRGGRGGRAGGGGGRGAAAAIDTTKPLTTVLGGSNYAQSREWFRPNPTPDDIRWGSRANTNIQESAVLFALSNTGRDRERFLENYWVKSKNAVNKGKNGPIKGWVIPADQHAKANAADAVNELIDQGLEFSTANSDFKVGDVNVKKGDWIVRGDQPFRTVADIYFSIQNYPTTNPSPYDDTGWTYQMMRNMVIKEINDPKLLTSPMTLVKEHVRAAGGIAGTGSTVIVEHSGDNNMVALRYRMATTKMSAAEEKFEAGGHSFPAGSFIIAGADHAALQSMLSELGLSAWAVASAPTVKSHDLDIPRIGYIHSWTNTQNEGWVRGALDYYKIPFKYFGENAVRKMGNLRSQFDVILWPSGGAVGAAPPTTGAPVPYMSTKEFPALGYPDSTSDTRGGLGNDGLKMLYEFVQAGGTVITEGTTSSIFPQYSLTPGLRTVPAPGLVDRGTILRGVISDMGSPINYGFNVNQLPIYFSGGVILDAGVPTAPKTVAQSTIDVLRPGSRGALAGGAFGGGGFGQGNESIYQNTQPMATWVEHSQWNPMQQWTLPASAAAADFGGGRGGFGGGNRAGAAAVLEGMGPRVVMQFPASERDLLLSGVLGGGENLSNRPLVVDSPIGQGHVVMFTMRPFWRWQTQGTFIMGFNAIMNWNDLNAGRAVMK